MARLTDPQPTPAALAALDVEQAITNLVSVICGYSTGGYSEADVKRAKDEVFAAARRGAGDTEADALSQAFADGRIWNSGVGQWVCDYEVGTVSRLAEGDTPLEAFRAALAARAAHPNEEHHHD